MSYIPSMEWEVEFTNEFEDWWNCLSEDEQADVNAKVILLVKLGPSLPAAARRSDSFFAAREHEGTSDSAFWQVLSPALCVRPAPLRHSADWWRRGRAMIAGTKNSVPVADGLYDRHLEALKKEQEKK